MSNTNTKPGQTECIVKENSLGHLTVFFPDYSDWSIYFQVDTDIQSFIEDCGGSTADPESIEYCPDDYLDIAD